MPSAPQPAAERWQLLKTIFQAAGSLSPTKQKEYLDAACGEDTDLRADAEALLKADREQQYNQTTPASSLVDGLISMRSLAGQRIGAYEILREIGRGGMSTVYAAARIDQQFQKLVAIKIVRPGLHFEEIVRRFQHERQLLAGLEHPNITRLLDAGVTDHNLPYLVMEYVEGIPIDRYAESNNLSIPERLTLFRAVCSAVQYAHQNLVVHRDIKPANILVTTKGLPKLLDFGIAKLLRPDYYGQNLNVTLPSVQPLTPGYASPEQIRGEPVTTASDVYSLGVLLYQLMSGRHPFAEYLPHPVALTTAILETEPTKPSAAVMESDNKSQMPRERFRRQLQGDLDTIILMALRKEPQRRYSSVEHLADDLTRYLEGRPVSARSDTALYRTGKFVRRHTAGVITSAVAVVALIAASALAIRSATIAHEQRATADRRFQEGRQFADFVLFQLDDAMRGGVTPARKLVVDRALQYLHGLEKDSADDPSLEHDIIEGYSKVGDLQGNLYGPNLGDLAAAKTSYEHALAIAGRLTVIHPSEPSVLRDKALIDEKLGNLLSLNNQYPQALTLFGAAKTTLEKTAASYPPANRDLLEVLRRMGMAQLRQGSAQQSLETYAEYLKLAQRVANQSPDAPTLEMRRDVAFGLERVGYLKCRTGSDGIEYLRQALAAYQDLAVSSPGNAALQRDIATTYSEIGDVEADHSPGDAVEHYREALQITEKLASADPQNRQYSFDRLITLGRIAYALTKSGRTSDAQATVARAVRLFEGVKPTEASDYDLITYCSILLTKPITDLANARRALQFARELAARTKEKDPFALKFLAEAQDATGDPASAIQNEQKAVALLPPDATADSRGEMEQELTEFRLHAASQKH